MPAHPDLGGTEQAVVQLAEALSARGHRIVADPRAAEVHVAINDAQLLVAGARRPIVWFHNEVSFGRELRRRRLPAQLRHRPMGVFCGAEQARGASVLLPLRARAVLPHGLPAAILDGRPACEPPTQRALFISQAYRGLAEVIGLWRQYVAPGLPGARLAAFIAPVDVPRYAKMAAGEASISVLPRVANSEMPALLAGARLVFAPGHRAETFCLAAAEAIAMGVPVVTEGTGALKERVRDGRTGFICRGARTMAERAAALLTDDVLWLAMQAEGLATRRAAGWECVAQKWEALVARHFG